MSWEEYVKEIEPHRNYAVALNHPLHGASPTALYGLNITSRGKNVGWVLDGDASRGYAFAFDENHDGDIDNDAKHPMVAASGRWSVEIETLEKGVAQRSRIAFDGDRVWHYERTRRTGTLRVDGQQLAFAIDCDSASCDRGNIGFDIDGDRVVDLESDGSAELYALTANDRSIVAFGRSYTFEVSSDRGLVTLRRSPVERAPRPSLQVGTPAPDFAIGATSYARLASSRGSVVVVDFFSKFCHFCIDDAPWLDEVHARYGARGVVIVTIATTDSRGAPELARPWPIVFEDELTGSIASLYRVHGRPTYFVVDRDGSIACSRCRRLDVDAALSRLFH